MSASARDAKQAHLPPAVASPRCSAVRFHPMMLDRSDASIHSPALADGAHWANDPSPNEVAQAGSWEDLLRGPYDRLRERRPETPSDRHQAA